MASSNDDTVYLERRFDPLEEGGEAQTIYRVARGSEVMGYVVIDAAVAGHSSGGLRLAPDVSEAEVRGLARSMTLKYGFLGMPQGGAKAGVIGDPEAPQQERRQRLAAFARAIAPLMRDRVYLPGADIGTDASDIRYMMETGGVRIKRREMRGNRSGYYTALTAFAGVRESARHLGLGIPGLSVAIEGFGKVGSALAVLLDSAGARIVAISTVRGAIFNPAGLKVGMLTSLLAEAGSRVVDLYGDAHRIDLEAVRELPVDVFCPCARQESVHAGNAARTRARIISAGANNPITPAAEQVLFDRGVLCLPDFVTSSGGVLGGRMELASIGEGQIASFIAEHVGAGMAWLLEESSRRKLPSREIAVPLALRRFQRLRQRNDRPGLRRRLFHLAMECHRRGWVPSSLVRALSLPYFERMLRFER